LKIRAFVRLNIAATTYIRNGITLEQDHFLVHSILTLLSD